MTTQSIPARDLDGISKDTIDFASYSAAGSQQYSRSRPVVDTHLQLGSARRRLQMEATNLAALHVLAARCGHCSRQLHFRLTREVHIDERMSSIRKLSPRTSFHLHLSHGPPHTTSECCVPLDCCSRSSRLCVQHVNIPSGPARFWPTAWLRADSRRACESRWRPTALPRRRSLPQANRCSVGSLRAGQCHTSIYLSDHRAGLTCYRACRESQSHHSSTRRSLLVRIILSITLCEV